MYNRTKSRFTQLAAAGAVIVALTSTGLYALPDQATAASRPIDVTEDGVRYGPPSFADLAEKVSPAVVSIVITGKADAAAQAKMPQLRVPQFPQGSPFGDFFRQFRERQFGMPDGDRQREFRASGSGFIISADGYVVTNNHVVENATEIKVVTGDGKRYDASLRGRDSKTDLALLKLDTDESLPYVELGDSDHARVGEWVVAVGNPFGLGGSVTAGIISARGRDINSGPFDDFIQVDAPINKGNSGGPLFDSRGRVIGVNTAIYSPSGGNVGIAFAIPSNLARQIIDELESSGKVVRGWLGVRIQPITDEIAEGLGLDNGHGALVAAVEAGSPAERGGIQTGDVIVSLDGTLLEDFKDLPKLVAATDSGSETTLQVLRRGQVHDLKIEIGTMPSEEVKVALADETGDATPRIGVYLAELTPETRLRFRIDRDTDGVLVAGVEPGSPAARAGIEPGSVIGMVGQQSVSSPDDVIARVRQAASDNRSTVLLMVEKDGRQQFVAVKFASS